MDILTKLWETNEKSQFKVKVSDGIRCRSFPVKEVVGYNEGKVMRYKNADGQLDVVYMSHDYRPILEDGFYVVGKRLGNNSACAVIDGKPGPVACEVIGKSSDRDCPGEDLSAIVRSDGLAIGYRALYESKIPWKLIVIAGIVAIVVIGIIVFMQSRGA